MFAATLLAASASSLDDDTQPTSRACENIRGTGGTEGTEVWSDGTELDYTNWWPGE